MRGEDWGGVIASCSVPLMCPIYEYKGRRLLDGGIASSISIEKSISDGNSFHVVVLTRNAGFVREPMGHERLIRAAYRKYPKLCEALAERHTTYNRQLALCEELEREGRALIIRPQKPLTRGRTSKDIPTLLALHDEGLEEGREAVKKLLQIL
jgi:predicted patatin/cPLA2 family phospholipase